MTEPPLDLFTDDEELDEDGKPLSRLTPNAREHLGPSTSRSAAHHPEGQAMTAATCAFEACQAGGDILPGAPRVDGRTVRRTGLWYHPGCWDAEQRRAEDHPADRRQR